MKKFILSLLAVAFVTTAFTQFQEIVVEEVENNGVVEGKTYRVYALMKSQRDYIDAVLGLPESPMRISTSTTFYQNERAGALASNTMRADLKNDPKLAFDSWVTIGLEDNYNNAVTGFLVDLSSFEAGNALESDNGAWFVTPDKEQAYAGPSKKILIMQLTTTGVVDGIINLHGKNINGEEWQSNGVSFTCGK